MRSRTLKPSFFKNEDLAECSPLARILFAGMWGLADCNGNLEHRPKLIKVEILPHDDVDVTKLIDELVRKGVIVPYDVQKVPYLAIYCWPKHGKPHPNEPATCPCKPKETKRLRAKKKPESLEPNSDSLGSNNTKTPLSLSSLLSSSSDSLNLTPSSSSSIASPTLEDGKPNKVVSVRKRDEVFDAIAEVTGTDPHGNGSLIGKVAATLKKCDPPYTALDVRTFAARFWEFCPYAAKEPTRHRPTPNEIEKNIGMVRAKPAPPQVRAGPGPQKVGIGQAGAMFSKVPHNEP